MKLSPNGDVIVFGEPNDGKEVEWPLQMSTDAAGNVYFIGIHKKKKEEGKKERG